MFTSNVFQAKYDAKQQQLKGTLLPLIEKAHDNFLRPNGTINGVHNTLLNNDSLKLNSSHNKMYNNANPNLLFV